MYLGIFDTTWKFQGIYMFLTVKKEYIVYGLHNWAYATHTFLTHHCVYVGSNNKRITLTFTFPLFNIHTR